MQKLSISYRIERRLLEYAAVCAPDTWYLKWKYRFCMHRPLNLKHPLTYTEKLQWLKLYYRKPEFTQMVDKIDAKDYVANRVGREYIIPTLGIWNDVGDIDWGILPERFVIKVSSDSGGVVVCKNKAHLDKHEAEAKLLKGWGVNYYKYNKEYPYKNVKPRIIAEEYLEDESGELRDFKIFCFDGKPELIFVASNRQRKDVETTFDFYDTQWNYIKELTNGHPNSGVAMPRPENLDEMLALAAKLSKGLPHLRVDLYNIKGKIYFGELTFFHWSGLVPFDPEEWDYRLGSMIKLPEKCNESKN